MTQVRFFLNILAPLAEFDRTCAPARIHTAYTKAGLLAARSCMSGKKKVLSPAAP
jgi:hypothetical protein